MTITITTMLITDEHDDCRMPKGASCADDQKTKKGEVEKKIYRNMVT